MQLTPFQANISAKKTLLNGLLKNLFGGYILYIYKRYCVLLT